jgi:hypothetical protein
MYRLSPAIFHARARARNRMRAERAASFVACSGVMRWLLGLGSLTEPQRHGEESAGRWYALWRRVVLFVARAFQPEFCAVRFGLSVWWLCRVAGPLTPDPSSPFHGGEGRISSQFSVFGMASCGRESAGGRPFRSSGFPARVLCFCVWNAWRSPLRGWDAVLSHAKPRRREGKRTRAAVVCGKLPALLSTFSHLLSMAWMPCPPHPRPLSPVSRGRGED